MLSLFSRDSKESKQTKRSLEQIDKAFQKHEQYPEFSSKISLESNNENGRFIAAQNDINANETILSEEAYSAVLYPDKNGMNCTNCLKRFKSGIGCKNCASVAFCCVFCRDEAQNTFHQWECRFQDVITGKIYFDF